MPVITFSEDGSVEFTRKPEMLALFEGERKQIDRMTDIIHHPGDGLHDLYYFKFLTGPFAGRNFDTKVYSEVDRYGSPDSGPYTVRILDQFPYPSELLLRDGDIYSIWATRTYEECAQMEVWFVDWMRRIMGESMAGPEALTIPTTDVLKANATADQLEYLKRIGGFGGSFTRVRILDNTPPPLFQVITKDQCETHRNLGYHFDPCCPFCKEPTE